MIFDPAVASGSAAAFAGILAAIVLAVIGQLATTGRDAVPGATPTGHKFQYSLIVGFPLLVQLLASAYMFVLLSGRLTVTASGVQFGALRGAAFDFAICGSVLAVAATGSLVFLRLVLLEAGRSTGVAATAASVVITVGIYVDVLFLVYGYGAIHAAFFGVPFPPGLWLTNAFVLVVPIVIGSVRKPPKLATTELSTTTQLRKTRLLTTAAVALGTLVPVWAFLIANNLNFDAHVPYVGSTVIWVSYLAGAWAGGMFGFLVWFGRATD